MYEHKNESLSRIYREIMFYYHFTLNKGALAIFLFVLLSDPLRIWNNNMVNINVNQSWSKKWIDMRISRRKEKLQKYLSSNQYIQYRPTIFCFDPCQFVVRSVISTHETSASTWCVKTHIFFWTSKFRLEFEGLNYQKKRQLIQ